MAKAKSQFVCQACGATAAQWQGQCGGCGAWNTMVEERPLSHAPSKSWTGQTDIKTTSLNTIHAQDYTRIKTDIGEFDYVLGGGLVPGSVVLIGGDPGIGKSTLLLQTLCTLSEKLPVLYVTGEESLEQVGLRATRLGLSNAALTLLPATQIELITHTVQTQKPKVLVIDSIQTMSTDQLTSAPGAVGQIRESTAMLVRLAKQTGTMIFLVGHVTKEGALAGPRVLEHMVDTVLYFEGDNASRYRILRSVKNRFGAVNEIGVFAMTDKGLRGVNNPSAIFLTRGQDPVPGSTILVTWEGTRPLLVEVQALVNESHLAQPRRVAVGYDQNRLAMLLAVLQRHGDIAIYDQDVFVNIVGGVKVTETAADLAVLCAIVSSFRNQPLAQDLILFGEVGLSGEIRPAPNGQERIKEAAKHGFAQAVVPKANAPKTSPATLKVHAVEKLRDALTCILA